MELWRTGLVLVLASTLCGALWVPGTEIVYQYYAHLDANTLLPTEAMSRWSIRAKLVVQVKENTLIVQLQDMTVATYNGPLHHNATIKETPPPEEIGHLLQPFILHLENGKVVDLSVEAGEDIWAINMKRGLAGLLQLDPAMLKSQASFSSETGLFGHSTVEYAVHNSTNGTISVTKNIEYSKDSDYPKQTLTNSKKLSCLAKPPQNPLDVVSIRNYELKPSGPNGELVLSSAVADGGIYYHPFRAESESLYIWTWMELHLKTLGTAEKYISVTGQGEPVGLKYELPEIDVSQGRSPPSQQELVSAVMKMLRELGDSLEPPGLETNLTKLHEERVAHVLYFLSLLNSSSFHQLYSDLAVGTSYQHETLRNLFLEVLPLVGSHEAILLIRDLVMGGTLKNDTAIQLLSALPFSVRKPSEQLLKDFEVILTLPEESVLYSSAILTFATLVHQVHKSGSGSGIIDKYVRQYYDLFNNSHSHEKQMLYLEALENFELKRVAEYLAPVIKGNSSRYSNHIRYLAAWTTGKYYATSMPREAYQLYWPILTNYDEPLEMRVAALTILLLSFPTAGRIYRLQSFMLNEPDLHLQHYWYTTLQSAAHTKNPCFLHMVDIAKKVLLHVPEPSVHHWATGNYVLDYTDPKYGFGSQTNLYMVASPQTDLPSTVYLEFSNYAMDYVYNQYSLYLRLDGIGDYIKRVITKRPLSLDKLVELLKQLKLPVKATEKIHIEVILEVQSKVVLVHYANETTFSSLFGVLNNIKVLANGGVHVNAQNVVVPFLLEEMRMTDLGTTALLRVTNSWMTSIRANLTTGKHILKQMELRSYLSSQTALTQYNPILDVWHGVQRSLNLQAIVPFDLQISMHSTEGHIKFAVQQTPSEEAGVVGHVRTVVFVRGITAAEKLKAHCATCPSQEIVTSNKNYSSLQELVNIELLGIQLQLTLLECEHTFHKEDLLEQLQQITVQQNSDVFPATNSLISLVHLYDYITLVPPSGSCGVLAKLSSIVEEPTQVEVEIIVNRTVESQSGSLEPVPSVDYNVQIVLTTNSSSHWEINTQYEHSAALSRHQISTNISSHDGHMASWNLSAVFPEPSPSVTFLSGVESHSAAVEINAEWDSSSLQILMEGEVTAKQQERMTDSASWPYNVCKNDLHDTQQWGHQYAPLTQACFEIARELATLRRYNFSITSSDLPSWLDGFSLDNVNIELEVPLDSLASFTVNGRKKTLSSSNTKKLQPWLVNTQFPPILQLATSMGSVGSCVVTSRSVWTMDGANLNISVGHCYSLALVDCSDTPQFAVFMKKQEGTSYPLALKVYSGNNFIELLPTADKLSIIVDNNEVKNPQKGYRHPVHGSNYQFKVWERSDGLVRIHLSVPHLWIEYYRHFATMTMPGIYHGRLCGVCGDHNGDASDDTAHLYTLACPE